MQDTEFYGFNPVSHEDWIEKIKTDLKGASFEEKLLHQSEDGIAWSAVYKRELVGDENYVPGALPYKRGTKRSGNDYVISQSFNVDDKETNKYILDFLVNGGQELILSGNPDNLKAALEGVHTNMISLVWNGEMSSDAMSAISEIEAESWHFAFDPNIEQGDIEEASSDEITGLKTLVSIKADSILNAGGGIVNELLYALTFGHETLHKLMNSGLTIDDASAKIRFHFAFGMNYLQDIAKIRAFREMWANVVSAYSPEHKCAHNAIIHGTTMMWNKIKMDINNNLLRASSESMSAVLSGVDSFEVSPVNLSKNSEATNRRLARNIMHLVNEESYLNHVSDPLAGSYAIENLHSEIREKVWSKFRSIDDLDLADKMKSILTATEDNKKAIIENVKASKRVLIGGNKFPQEGEQFDADKDLKFVELS